MALQAHPLIAIVDENDARFHIQGKVTRELDLEAFSGSAIDPDDRAVGFKTPRDSHRIGDIARAFPSVRVIWVERELRQTVSSMLNLRTAEGSWASTFAPKEITKHLLKTQDEKAQSLFLQTTQVPDTREKSVALATLCWCLKREQLYSATQLLGPRLRRVDYDEITINPSRVLRGTITFLGLPWSPQVLRHSTTIADVARPGGADARRPIDVHSRQKWKGSLSPVDLAVISDVKRSFGHSGEASDARRRQPE